MDEQLEKQTIQQLSIGNQFAVFQALEFVGVVDPELLIVLSFRLGPVFTFTASFLFLAIGRTALSFLFILIVAIILIVAVKRVEISSERDQ